MCPCTCLAKPPEHTKWTAQRTKTRRSTDRNPVASAVRAFRRGSPFCVALATKLAIRKGCDARLHVSSAARSREAIVDRQRCQAQPRTQPQRLRQAPRCAAHDHTFPARRALRDGGRAASPTWLRFSILKRTLCPHDPQTRQPQLQKHGATCFRTQLTRRASPACVYTRACSRCGWSQAPGTLSGHSPPFYLWTPRPRAVSPSK